MKSDDIRCCAEALPHPVFSATTDGRIDYGNAAWRDYTGVAADDPAPEAWRSAIHPSDLARYDSAWRRALRTQSPLETQLRLRRAKDGAYRWFVSHAAPLREGEGVAKWIGSHVDIDDFRIDDEIRNLLDRAGHCIFVRNFDGSFEYVSPALLAYTGFSGTPPVASWKACIHPDDLATVQRHRQTTHHCPQIVAQSEVRVRGAGGEYRWFAVRSVGMSDGSHEPRRWLTTLTDIDDLKRTKAAFGSSESRYRALTDAMPHMVWIVSDHGTLEYVNDRWCAYTGRRFAAGLSLADIPLFHPDDLAVLAANARTLRDQPESECEVRMLRNDYVYRWQLLRSVPLLDGTGPATKWIVTATDIETSKLAEATLARTRAELTFRAHHDPLTGLPNRTRIIERVTTMIAEAKRHGTDVFVLYLDLDHFKAVNDTLGHTAGDRLLIEIAQRLRSAIRSQDIAGRFDGDEFVVACIGGPGDDPAQIAERLQNAIRAPFALNGIRIAVASSIGVSASAHDGDDARVLIHKADAAMSAAKNSGRNASFLYQEQTHRPRAIALDFEANLREAIERDQLVVYYQPIVDIASGTLTGAEALVRWDHPTRGLLSPAEFIPTAESQGLISLVGEVVLRAACRQIEQLRLREADDFTIAVNVSARQFARPGFVATVASAIDAHGIEARRLDIEITESIVMGDTDSVSATLDDLKALGVRISIDDFGTGYSSLAYIKNFPAHTLKIDKSFVAELSVNVTDQAIAKTIVTLAHNLGMRVIAEGVETTDQRDRLRAFGADCMQGYLVSRPLPAAEFASFLTRHAMDHAHTARGS